MLFKQATEMKNKSDTYNDLNFRAEYQKFASRIQHEMNKASIEGKYQISISLKNMSREMFWYIDTELKMKKYNVVSTWGFYRSDFIINWYRYEMEENK
jgi:hypothetical protein